MDRWNPEGLPRDQLLFFLKRPDRVMAARKNNRCLLCCQSPVHEGGLCDRCTPFLNDEERRIVERYMAGVGP